MTSDDWSPGEPLMAGLNRTLGGMGRVLDELQVTVREAQLFLDLPDESRPESAPSR